jgi:O-antigen/teichoic acid export membrane protein
MSEQLLRLAINFFIGVWLARYLTPETYGIYSYSIAYVVLFQGIAKLGLDQIAMREIVKSESDTNKLLGTIFWLKVGAGFFSYALIFTSLLFIEVESFTKSLILILSLGLVFQSYDFIGFYYQAKVQAKILSLAKIFQVIISSLLKLICIYSNKPLEYFIYIKLFDYISLAFVLLFFFKIKEPGIKFFTFFDFSKAKFLLRESLPIVLGSLFITIYMRIDQIMLKHFLTSSAVGLYSVVVQVVEVLHFVPSIICISLFPAMVNSNERSSNEFENRVVNLYRLLIGMSFFITILGVTIGPYLISLLFGDAYNESGDILIYYMWSTIFVFIGGVSQNWFIAKGLQKYSTINTLVGAIINIILNYYLIRTLGVIGAAIATTLSYAVAAYFMNLFFRNTRENFKLISKGFLFYKIDISKYRG